MKEIRQAFRSLRRAPGFTVISIATLGLAIGAVASIFSVIDTVLLDPLPYADNDRLISIAATAPGSDFPDEFGVAAEFFVQYQESTLLEGLSPYNAFTSTLRAGDRVERIWMSAPTPSLFPTLGVEPILGRLPVAEDEGGVAVLSHQLWTSWFGGDPDVIGQRYSVSGEDRTIIGVMPRDFFFPHDGVMLWFPNVIRPDEIETGRFGMPLVAKKKPGVSDEELATELGLLAKRIPDRWSTSPAYARLLDQHRPVIKSLEVTLLGDVSGPLWILLAAMGIVLLIACANVANLFMVRAERHQGDQAIRGALGAGRARLVMVQLTEAAVIAGTSGVVAVILTASGVPLLIQAAPTEVPRLSEVAISPTTLIFTFVASAMAALLCGLVPALRFSAPNLLRLREGTRGSTRRRHWGRHVLVVAQTALALILLIGSALLLRSFDKLRNVDPGYDTENLFTFQIAPEGEHLNDATTYARFHLAFMDRLRALPGVESVGIVENVPLNEGLADARFRTEENAGQEDTGTVLSFTYSAGDYFETMGIEVSRGRAFTNEDHFSQAGPVLISRSAARALWPGQDPIGKRLQFEGGETWETVIGVVDDVLQYGFRQEADPMLYFPMVGQDPENSRTLSSPAYVLKTERAERIAPEIRALVREVAPMAPMYRTYTLAELAKDSMSQLAFTMLTLGIAAAMALILGVIGLYGVLSYAVAERTREIGVRMALGAKAARVRMMVVSQGAKLLAVGLAVGFGAAILVSRSLEDLLFNVKAFDIGIYLAISVLMAVVGLAACYIPARRASMVDPMESLRSD